MLQAKKYQKQVVQVNKTLFILAFTNLSDTSTTEIQLLKHKRAALVRFGVSGIRGTGLVDRLALDC